MADDSKQATGEIAITSHCPICDQAQTFTAPKNPASFRAKLRSADCPLRTCNPRSRGLADVFFSLYPRDTVAPLDIHESSPGPNGISLWLRRTCPDYIGTGYFPEIPFGEIAGHLRNENLEAQTFGDETFDIVIHLDVMEHLFAPFQALREIERTLKPGGRCLFTAPTYADRLVSEQVAFLEDGGGLRIVGAPEYHGNPQDRDGGSLVTWRYGYDLPARIGAETGFDIEVRRWHAPGRAVMGAMTEVYILTKPG